jgi:hypothetical protein
MVAKCWPPTSISGEDLQMPVGKLARLLIIGFVALAGCNGQPTPVGVRGTVTFDGAPLAEGTLQFEPLELTTGQSREVAIRDGKFSLPASEGVLPGVEFRVVIQAFKKTGQKYPNADMAASYDEVVQYIPEQYNTATTLRATVSPNETENDLTFHLLSQPASPTK